MTFKDYPKMDLHCHLDGSLSVAFAQRELARQGRTYNIEEIIQQMVAPERCTSLADYLTRFNLPIDCVQTPEAISEAAYELAKAAWEEHVLYLETRYSPAFCSAKGMSYIRSMEAVEKGFARAREEFGIRTGIIICGMRHLPAEDNIRAVKAAREMLGSGVVAVDVAGDEKAFTNLQVREMFDYARKVDMPFTMHAGECGRAENIREAIELGASRVGHGIAMAGCPDLIRLCADQRIGVEMCPVSNLQTLAVESLEKYPFLDFLQAGVPVTVNTDNRTVSGTSCTREWETLASRFEIDEEIMKQCFVNGIEVAFADDAVKHELWKAIRMDS